MTKPYMVFIFITLVRRTVSSNWVGHKWDVFEPEPCLLEVIQFQ